MGPLALWDTQLHVLCCLSGKSKFNGRSVQGWGNASTWNTNASNAGYTVNGTPAVGDIVQWPTAAGGIGHVAYVYAVNNGVASISEYNHGNGRYYTPNRTVAANTSGVNFIHMGAPSGGASWHGVGSYANRGESLASGATLYLNQYMTSPTFSTP